MTAPCLAHGPAPSGYSKNCGHIHFEVPYMPPWCSAFLPTANTQMPFCVCPVGPALPEGDTLRSPCSCGFQRLMAEPHPHGTILCRRFLSNVWHFFPYRVSAEVSPGPLSGPEPIVGMNMMTSPALVAPGIAPGMTTWFAAILPCLLLHPPHAPVGTEALLPYSWWD